MSNGNPELRPVEIVPFREAGRELVCLRDPAELAPDPIVIDAETFFIISMFDGEHTVVDMQEAYIRRFGSLLFSDRIRDIIRELDDNHLMLTPEFTIFQEALYEEFAASTVREAAGAGTSYPDEPTELAHMLGAILKEAPAVNVAQRPGTLCGLIAPHIDYVRGGVAYAHAYREVEPLPSPQLVLLLGTSHAPTENRFALTRKHFATPFGQATTDVEFVEALAAKLPFDAFADEFVHRSEHSIELEVVWLKYLLRQPDALRIVPVLCGSFDNCVRAGQPPSDDEQVSAFVDAVREISRELRAPTLILAGADLSHVGPRFGDAAPVETHRLSQVEGIDMQFLTRVGRGDADGAFQSVAEHADSTHICGLAPIVVLLKLLGEAQGRLFNYQQWHDPNGLAAVTFASVGLYLAGEFTS